MTIADRLDALRQRMNETGLDAYIVPSTDPHQGEYPPGHWKSRQWISGFDGSAGTVVVTATEAGLWTDSRYFLIAEKQLQGSPVVLFRMDESDVPTYEEWLGTELQEGQTVGFDALCVSLSTARALERGLTSKGIQVQPGPDLFDGIWTDRPALPLEPVYLHPDRFAGQSRGEKLSLIREQMAAQDATHHLISTLDDIAWLLNLRGSDVPYNPVAVAHLILGQQRVELFIEPGQLSEEVRQELERDGVGILPYNQAVEAISDVPGGSHVIVSPGQSSVGFTDALDPGVHVLQKPNLTTLAKARKNAVELDHIRAAMVRDGIAMVRFLHWVVTHVGDESITELSAEDKLREFRSDGENFVSESFRTISAYRGHGASPHYSSDPDSNVQLEPAGLYLVDSGAQYLDGTTDITRTVALGEPSEQERRDFTLVLKGHISLAMLHFPVGTPGELIDAITRQHLWQNDMNYLHGTGHGIGFFLNVHEGPQRISRHPSGVPLEPGMVISNEPGLYRPERYGIRTENLIVVREQATTEFGSFLGFETVTLCPFDRNLIEIELLTPEERQWVDDYHRRVRESLRGDLTDDTALWLDEMCAPL